MPLTLTQLTQTTVHPAHLALQSQEPSFPPLNEQSLWALLQKLPASEDFYLAEIALRGALKGPKQEVADMTSRVSTLETDSAALRQDVSSLQGTHNEVSDQSKGATLESAACLKPLVRQTSRRL